MVQQLTACFVTGICYQRAESGDSTVTVTLVGDPGKLPNSSNISSRYQSRIRSGVIEIEADRRLVQCTTTLGNIYKSDMP